jgi:predicted phosphohydrolase
MRIHLLSDLHLECAPYAPHPVDADVVVLAGDLDKAERALTWIHEHWPDVPVIWVFGNHEFWGGRIPRTRQKVLELAAPNVRILELGTVVINGVRFLGATAWSDWNLSNNRHAAMVDARAVMRDYQKIRVSPTNRRLRPADTLRISQTTHTWLKNELSRPFRGHSVVVTHHAPHPHSIPADDPFPDADGSDWTELLALRPDLWLHGHVHRACDYAVTGTRVVCNPRGYPGEDTGFDPSLVIEI